ncbi:MAG: S8 family serine peptidase [Gemmatimonadota bacterium]|nr:MAG: S8 family serine peptidase [Gemmatimonadota bacterium]
MLKVLTYMLFLCILVSGQINDKQVVASELSYEPVLAKFLTKEKSAPVIHPIVWERAASTPSTPDVVVWIFFTDKGISSKEEYRTARHETERQLSERTVRRREKVSSKIDFTDLPVKREYIEAVLNLGAKHRTTTKWFNGMSAEVPLGRLEEIANLPFVREIRLVNGSKREPIQVKRDVEKPPVPHQQYQLDYGPSLGQLEQINVPAVHELGYSGDGVILCILDTGFNLNHESLQHVNLIAEYDFINKDGTTANEPGDPRTQEDHGTSVLSTVGGASSGNLYGPAYGASYILAKTEDISSETTVEEDYWVAALEWADGLGADIASSSLIYINWYTYEDMDGNTAVITKAADMAAAKGILVCNAAGNERDDEWFYIGAPADADSILACGAVTENGQIAFFSSSGPSSDGRTKPEVAARGDRTYVADPSNPAHYYNALGTSYATPLIAGAAALVLEAHPDWTPLQVREALMMTASQAHNPNNLYGWGIIDALAAMNYGSTESKGDINGDGIFNITDIKMAVDFILNFRIPFHDQGWAADCNDDGEIDVIDIICIVRLSLDDG